MAEELFRVEYDGDGMPKRMHIGKYGIKLDQEDAQRIFDKYFDMRDTVDVMREENEKLKAQNKRLRKECTYLRKSREREFAKSCEAATNSMGQIGTLRDKNAELRELVHDLSICAANTWVDYFDCDECPLNDKHDCDFDRRAQDLGIEIEVDE